ncbi:MAG TPA: serine--tRNA ligase, partial [Burkholderiales bacterium]|nr:serine--tRNA ligase [Burkholderiales bacterium]
MLDLQTLRTDLAATAQRLSERGYTLDVAAFEALEQGRKTIQTETQDLQARRNQLSKQVGQAKAKGEDAADLMAQVSAQADQLKALEQKLTDVQSRLNEFLQTIPNVPHASVPVGQSADDNPEVRRVGTPRTFDFPVKDHVDIGAGLGLLDFDAAVKIAGARFSVMKGPLARLHRALAQFMLDVHTAEHGYTEVYVPYMVNAASANGVSSLAKFKDDLFKIEGRDLYLIPTAEYPVTNLVREEILPGAQLPLKFVCHSPCFRSEAGSYGKDTRGMIRQHQFDKVELVQIVHPSESYDRHEELT